MSKKIAFIFPGQGAQYAGMGRDFFEQFSAAKAIFQKADEILGTPFSETIFKGPSEDLTLTKNSQLAIFITSVAILEVVKEQFPEIKPTICAGLSLGEYTALVASGKLSFEQALPIVQARGNAMHQACKTHPGTMHVVLGLDLPAVEAALEGIDDVWIANLNCPGQIVIAGKKEPMESAAAALKEKGAKRVIPLDVSGAFHSGLMKPAQETLKPLIDALEINESPTKLVMNVTGNFADTSVEMRQNMVFQVTRPVYWQKGIEIILEGGIDAFIEMGPGKTLAGMNKRIGVKAPTLSIERVEDLEKIRGEAHATT